MFQPLSIVTPKYFAYVTYLPDYFILYTASLHFVDII